MVGGIENEGESMPRTRKNYAPTLKAKVAVEAIKGNKTATQIGQAFSVHPNLVAIWKKQALDQLPDIFSNGQSQTAGRCRKGRAVSADRQAESRARLSQKKSWPVRLRKSADGSTRNIRELSIRQQCELLGLPTSTYYYQPRPESDENLRLLRQLDELYLQVPFFGSRRMAVTLNVNRKRMQRLMRILGIEALYPKPNLSRPEPGRQIFPYLLRDLEIVGADQVWSTDITYIPMRGGFLYLVAVMDWFSRFVLSWELSNTMETGFCLAALDAAFRFGKPDILNSDQGPQFTSADFLAPLRSAASRISMDGRGRASTTCSSNGSGAR